MTPTDELVFLPLGGLGEIGMNAALYGFGPERRRKWILVDCGMGFASEEHMPGVDVMYPDLSFIEKRREDLLGILITHAHEDHIGALVESWPQLRVPVYATRFAASLIEARKLSEPGAPKIVMHEVTPGKRFRLGPFEIDYVPVSHSIPESNALAIRTEFGLVVHSGDWKIDPTPFIGGMTSETAFRALGDEGILALVCDSTNVLRDGQSPSESEVAASLKEIIAGSPHRVAVTTFASNVARIRAVAEGAKAAGREVVVVGRAMDRVIGVATELGYLSGLPEFSPPNAYGYLQRDRVVALLTGSQGEPRAALARIADDEHPDIALSPGDRVIFSSRTIPGNENSVGGIVNSLVRRGIDVVTDRGDKLVHVSGHPRREELRQMYEWTRPRIAIPAHGEDLHLSEHADFARQQNVPEVVKARNGTVVRLAPGPAAIVNHVSVGRLYRDGDIVVGSSDRGIPERRKLASSGVITIAIALDRGEVVGRPRVEQMGLPAETRDGEPLADIIDDAVEQVLGGLPRGKRRDAEAVEKAVAGAVRGALRNVWGKKPACQVLVIEV